MSANDDGPPWLLLAGVWLIYGAFGLVAASLAPLVGSIVTELNISHSAMGSVMGAWQLVYIGAAIPCGMLLDRLPSRWALLLGALLVAASALGRSLAEGYWTLLLAVMLFGLGGPIISVGAPKVIAQHFTGHHRGLAMGIYITGPALGGVVCLTLTHSLLLPLFDQNWRLVLQLWAGFAVAAGLVWFALASRHRSNSVRILKVQQDLATTTEVPALSVRQLLRLPAVRLVMLMSVGVFFINHGLNNWLPELLRNKGMSAEAAGYWAALPILVGIAGSLLIPRFATPQRRFAILASLCVAALLACLLLLSTATAMSFGLLLQGIARSSLMTVLILTLVELPGIGDRNAGTASGLFFSAAEVGGMLGPLSLGVVYDLTHGFSAGLYALAAVAAALALSVARLQRMARADPAQARTTDLPA
ncbi:MAG: MFS transporter [Pseudomonadales bacterium]